MQCCFCIDCTENLFRLKGRVVNMKHIKIIAVFLLISILACSFVACGKSDDDANKTDKVEKDTTPPPEGTQTEGLVELTVSFVINDGAGTNIYSETNYKYKGFDPTIFGVIKQYVEVDMGGSVLTYDDDDKMIEYIDEYGATDSSYWVALKGKKFITGQSEEISLSQMFKPENKTTLDMYIIKSMSQYRLTDGETFTVVLGAS